jgi:hypothetical protein
MRHWLSDSEFQSRRRNAPHMAYCCEKCGRVGVPSEQRGYDTATRQIVHQSAPYHLPDGRVNLDNCRGKVVWREVKDE